MKKKKKRNPNIRFIRKNGRIIPIRIKPTDKQRKTAGAVGAAGGAAVAADAARTKTIFVDKKNKIRIDKKTNVRASLSATKRADELQIFKNGKKAGFANFSKNFGKDFTFNFLRIKKKFQKQGLSKILTEEVGREIKRKGGKTTTNQVIHKGSALSNFRRGKDSFVDEFDTRISKKKALDEIELFQELSKAKNRRPSKRALSNIAKELSKSPKKFLKANAAAGLIRDSLFPDSFSAKDSGVFRQTSLKGLRKKGKHSVKPFRTRSNKLKLAGGAIAVGVGTAQFFRGKDEKR